MTLASNFVGAEPTSAAHEMVETKNYGQSSVFGLNSITSGVDRGA